jgi:hypothetical protein
MRMPQEDLSPDGALLGLSIFFTGYVAITSQPSATGRVRGSTYLILVDCPNSPIHCHSYDLTGGCSLPLSKQKSGCRSPLVVLHIAASQLSEMTHEIALLAALFLAGCSPSQSETVAACRIEADRFFQGYNDVDVNNPRSRYVIECMAAKGYDFDISPTDCDSRHPLATQATCYRSQSWLTRVRSHFYR